jgi:hypothetical protein
MKHEIEIPDLPEGLEAVAYRKPKSGEYYLTPDWITVEALHDYKLSHLIVRKKQPRRIVLEETCKEDRKAFLHAGKHWKIVEDNKCAE